MGSPPSPSKTILFLHQNFPAQFVHLAHALAGSHRYRVVALTGGRIRPHPAIRTLAYDPLQGLPGGQVPACQEWLSDVQSKALRARAVLKVLVEEVRQGFAPDLIVGHTGWGELLAIRELFASTPFLAYPEFFYHLRGADINFDPEFSRGDPGEAGRLAFRNATQLLALQQMDWGLVPTWWQWSLFPEPYRSRLSVIHEGIDCRAIRPRRDVTFRIERAGLTFAPGDELVTFISRTLEPYRGFHVFMRMLPDLMRLRPRAHVLIIGSGEEGYGSPPPQGFRTWKDCLLDEVGPLLDPGRIHFLGRLPHATLHSVLQVSACHVYLTLPFVLSWSLLEAMACGALVVASNTAPLREVIRDGVNGRLVNYPDPPALARTIAAVLADPEAQESLRQAARRTVVERYDLTTVCLPRQIELVEQLLAHRQPPAPCPPPGLEEVLFRHPEPLLQETLRDSAPATAPASPSP